MTETVDSTPEPERIESADGSLTIDDTGDVALAGSIKPPLGLIPRRIREEQRLREIGEAVARYTIAGKPVPQEWQDEGRDLIRSLRGERDDTTLVSRMSALASDLVGFDVLHHDSRVPDHVVVPDDYEAGVNDAGARVRAALAADLAAEGDMAVDDALNARGIWMAGYAAADNGRSEDTCPYPEGDAEPRAFIDVVFDGPPSHESGRFVEVENPAGRSVSVGEWIDRGDGMWALRIPTPDRDAILAAGAFNRPEPHAYAVEVLCNAGSRFETWRIDDEMDEAFTERGDAEAWLEEQHEAGFRREHLRVVTITAVEQ